MSGPQARVIFAGGGTGGHLFPAIAIADRVRELLQDRMGVDIRFVGTRRGLEYRVRESLGYPLHLISIRGLVRGFTLVNLLLPFVVIGALAQAASLLKRYPPDVVIGTGGYVSWPVLRIAAFKNIATVLQEQNSFPGITTRKLARFARRIFLGFESARRYIHSDGEVIASGNPVRRSILNGDRAAAVKEFGLDPSRRTILVLGGSQGARAINNAVLAGIEKNRLPEDFQILWQTGKRDYKDVTARAGRKAARCALFPFAHRMDLVYAAADVAIARAGALTIAELAACGIPSILVPYPHAAGDHQRKNAQDLTERNLAVAIDEGNLDTIDLLSRAVSLVQSDDYLRMKQALQTCNAETKPAVDVIAEGIISLIDEARKGGHRQ